MVVSENKCDDNDIHIQTTNVSENYNDSQHNISDNDIDLNDNGNANIDINMINYKKTQNTVSDLTDNHSKSVRTPKKV